MVLLLSLIWIISFNGIFVCLFRRRFEETLTLSLMCGALVLYVFSFFSALRLGFYVLMAMGLLFWVYLLLKRKNVKKILGLLFTPGLCAFFFMALCVFVIYHRKGFENADEFMHWGPMVLSSLKHNGFYLSKDILLVNNDYPPFMTLIKMIWIGFNGFHYSEPLLFTAQLTFYFSCPLPLFSSYRKEDWKKIAALTAAVILIGFWMPSTYTAQEWAFLYNSVYLDWVLPAMAVYTYLIFRREGINSFSAVTVSISLACVLLSKQIGLCYYLIIGFMIIVKGLQEKDKKKMIPVGIMAAVPLAVYLTWMLAVRFAGASGVYDVGKISLGELWRNLRTYGTYEHTLAKDFLSAIFTRNLSSYPFTLSYMGYSLLMLAGILVMNRKKDILLSFSLLCGTIGYALVMAVLYMTLFEEGGRLPSFDRYMLSYLYFEVLIFFALIVEKVREVKKPWAYALAALLLLVSINYSSLPIVTPAYGSSYTRVLVVDNTDSFYPSREDVDGMLFGFRKSHANEEDFGLNGFLGEVKESDLLYIVNYDPPFYDIWKQISPDLDPYTGVVIAIEEKDGQTVFMPMWSHHFNHIIRYYLLEKN